MAKLGLVSGKANLSKEFVSDPKHFAHECVGHWIKSWEIVFGANNDPRKCVRRFIVSETVAIQRTL